MTEYVKLAGGESLGELKIRLACSSCHGGNDESDGGALTIPIRKKSDPDSVVRCGHCGKKHSRDSLEAITAQKQLEQIEDEMFYGGGRVDG